MRITKLKKYQIEEHNNSSLSILELIDNNHEENKDDEGRDKGDTNKKSTKLKSHKVNNQHL
jgi:hypothetical protein